ncbi:LysM peptidoglycan-binding domain-containing protein, partial [Erwinia oleae]
MSTGSPIFTLRRIAAVSLVGFCLTGCSSDNTQAPISSVGSRSGEDMSTAGASTAGSEGGGGLINRPASISTNAPVQAPVSAPVMTNSTPESNVATQNGRIVYNRSYGNIPKGSYSGQTYTVKRGDTLFYIAWITGNDFRDLAQRNNVAAPYGLNVGQQLQVSN